MVTGLVESSACPRRLVCRRVTGHMPLRAALQVAAVRLFNTI